MLARVGSYLLHGIDALACEVEVDVDEASENKELTVGLPDAAVKESLQRVRSAVGNSGYALPRGRVLINLAPADVRKEGPVYDLPIAIGMLMAQGVIRPKPGEGLDPRRHLLAGELALDGRLRPIRGALALAELARTCGAMGVILPAENAPEASVVESVEVHGVRTLAEAVGLLTGAIEARPMVRNAASMFEAPASVVDFAEIRGQEGVKRALLVAAAGGHNALMLGPAGTGKTMMARALPGILPPLSVHEAIEITRIYSAAGLMPLGQGLITARPVRTPHHTASAASIVGGGMVPKPGEISLAHHGILFLDELPEFPRNVLETLRQPLEDQVVTISRAHGTVRFPASFMLVAAMNPTFSGQVRAGDTGQRDKDRYMSRLSGPLLDRIDIHVEAPAVAWKELSSAARGTGTAQLREGALAARERQRARQGRPVNARLSGKQLDEWAPMHEAAKALLGQAISELGLSARAYDKVRRVSRTIADLEGTDRIELSHVAEAVQYRLLDRKV